MAMIKRFKEVMLKLLALFLIGIGYLIWCKFTGIFIPCMFRKITGLYCPGCGATHLFISLAKLDFIGAFWANPVMFVLLPLLFVILLYYIINYIKYGEIKSSRTINILIWISIISLTIFAVIRNIIYLLEMRGM